MNFENETIGTALHNPCSEGGDASEDCKDCVYGEEYHLVDGDCLLRTYEPSERHLEPSEEVAR